MPIFEYKALTADGQATTATIDADSAKEARERLRTERLFVTSLRELAAAGAAPTLRIGGAKGVTLRLSLRRGVRVPPRELVVITRQLALLLHSGIPLAQALAALIEQTAHRGMEITLRDVREKITQGVAFADAMAQHPKVFSDLYVNMCRAGEAAGNLDEILARLGEYLTKQNRLRQKISSAMTYPIILMGFGALVVIFLMTVVVPRITDIFATRGGELPLLTRIVKGTSDFMIAHWYLGVGGVAAAVLLFKMAVATERGRWLWDAGRLKAPALGDVLRKAAVSRFCITLSALLKSGLPALDSLKIVKTIVQNRVMERTVQEVHDRILEGADISTPLKESGVFPPVVGYMIAVGEQAGQLDEILDNIAETYDEELEFAVQRFTAVLEPVMIIFMAVVVCLIVASILLPLVQMSQLVRGDATL